MRLSAVVLQPGAAKNYLVDELKDVPLIVKANMSTRVPGKPTSGPLETIDFLVDDFEGYNLKAFGWTFYFGSDSAEQHYRNQHEMAQAIEAAHRRGIPFIVWAYPRGKNVDKYGGAEALPMIADTVAHAADAGADIIKCAYPLEHRDGKSVVDSKKEEGSEIKKHGDYGHLSMTPPEGLRWIVEIAGPVGIIVSGGPKLAGKELTIAEKTQSILDAQADGVCYGRNMYQHDATGAVKAITSVMEVLNKMTKTGQKVDIPLLEEAVEKVQKYSTIG
jgi:class I fructose-bisphosphate aldolase